MISHKEVRLLADSVIIKIDGDSRGYEKTFNNIVSLTKKGTGIMVKGAVAASTALGTATVAALKFSGELEQNIGGSAQVFKEKAQEMQATAEKAFDTMGLSASDFLANANKIGALLQGSGFGIPESAQLATNVMQRASDVASIMGIEVSAAMEAVTGAAKGNFTMMDNLGVAMNATTIEAYALAKGINTSYASMDNQQKVGLAMEMFLEKTAYAAGNYARENETLAGSLNTAKAALKNFMSGAGSVEDVTDSLSNASEVILKNIGELLPELVEGLEGIVDNLIPVLPEIISKLIPSVISILGSLIENIADMTPELLSAIFEGLGEAVPVLQPLLTLIRTLTGDFENLNAIVIASATAFLTYKSAIMALGIIQNVSKWLSTAQVALNGYTAAVALNQNVSVLLASTLTPLQLAFGVLTGKINLTTAATLALKAAKDALSGGVGILIGIIAAATAGVIAYGIAHNNASEEICNSLNDIKKSHEDAISSIDKTVSSELAEAEIAQTLKKSLYDLEDQIKSGTLSEEEARIAQENFNITANKLNSIIPGIISNMYNENGAISIQRSEVDSLTNAYYDLAVAKAMANAYEQKMTETAKSLIDAKEAQKTARKNFQDTARDANSKYSLWELPKMLANTTNHTNAKTALDKANEAVNKYTKELETYKDGWTETTNEIEKLISQSVKKVDNGNGKMVESTKSAAKERSAAVEEQYKKELRDLQFYHDMGEISDEEYYIALEKFRDKYFEEGSEEWQKYTLQIQQFNEELEEKALKSFKDYAEEQTKAAQKSIEEVQSVKENMESSLKAYGSLFSQYELSTIEIGGVDITPTVTELSDIALQNEELREYAKLLEQLKGRGDIPTGILSEISQLSVGQGTAFIKELLKLNNAEFATYMSEWAEQQELAAEISDNFVNDEFTELKTSLEEKFGTVPEEFFSIGTDSAQQFGSGFMEKLQIVLDEAKAAVSNTLSSISPRLSFAGGNYGGGGNSYSSTYYIQPSNGESTQSQLKAIKDAQALEEARGKY